MSKSVYDLFILFNTGSRIFIYHSQLHFQGRLLWPYKIHYTKIHHIGTIQSYQPVFCIAEITIVSIWLLGYWEYRVNLMLFSTVLSSRCCFNINLTCVEFLSRVLSNPLPKVAKYKEKMFSSIWHLFPYQNDNQTEHLVNCIMSLIMLA